MSDFKCAVNEQNKATELPLLRLGGSVQQNPHMRAFWASTISFFLAFLAWFALAPLALDVAISLKICENQQFPPAQFKTQLAYLKFKSLKTGIAYCQYGKNDAKKPTECKPVPADILAKPICNSTVTAGCVSEKEKLQYRPDVLNACVCTPGTDCKQVLSNAGTISVIGTIVVRIAMGTLLERFGCVSCQTGLLLWGSFFIGLAATITTPWSFILIRFLVGVVGATFVTNQVWCSLMFASNVVGTANACAGGWGNLGGGVTQILMVLVLFQPFKAAGMAPDEAWRVAMLVPAILLFLCAVAIKLLCWDTPTARHFDVVVTGKTQKPSMWDYVEVLKAGDAAALASSFGLMNLFARSLGGILSDKLYLRFGFRGCIWAQFLALFFEAIFLFGFGCVDNSQPWYVALIVLVCFSMFVQMAEGTTYGIVPFMIPKQLPIISALVGAGGNLGAMIAGFAFYGAIDDAILPFKVHGCYVMFFALLSPMLYWPEYGGMFHGPAAGAVLSETAPAKELEQETKKAAKEDEGSEHLRMGGVYWGVSELASAMALLRKLDDEKRKEDLVEWCRDPKTTGGFGSNIGHDADITSTHYVPLAAITDYFAQALLVLCMYDAVDRLDVEGLKLAYLTAVLVFLVASEFTRFAYCALSALTILDALDRVDVDACTQWVLPQRCMNYEGSFGPVPRAESHAAYVFCAVSAGSPAFNPAAALALAGALEAAAASDDLGCSYRVDLDQLGWWLCERQTPGGGFNGRPEKAREAWHTRDTGGKQAEITLRSSRQSSFGRVRMRLFRVRRQTASVVPCCFMLTEDGGIADRPGDVPDVFQTFFGLAGLSLMRYHINAIEVLWLFMTAADMLQLISVLRIDRAPRAPPWRIGQAARSTSSSGRPAARGRPDAKENVVVGVVICFGCLLFWLLLLLLWVVLLLLLLLLFWVVCCLFELCDHGAPPPHFMQGLLATQRSDSDGRSSCCCCCCGCCGCCGCSRNGRRRSRSRQRRRA
ncbi:unnamed protein product [Polarella glacialis]|uniref:Prenyltransferase alpha-alpha toroid domain-containing protein n=1 Tax=Polarella glacialis TaxID=89957 RepID=A0A813L8K0_POLGL|nr:unnamed protein product [Polarella glacialis]